MTSFTSLFASFFFGSTPDEEEEFCWCGESEYSGYQVSNLLAFQKIKSPSISYWKKWLDIALLRDQSFFQNYIFYNNLDDYNEYLEKVDRYILKHGKGWEKCFLTFAVYKFTPSVSTTILNMRNYFGLTLFKLYLVSPEVLDTSLPQEKLLLSIIKSDITDIYDDIKSSLVQCSFDLGCSSEGLGKMGTIFLQTNGTNIRSNDAMDSTEFNMTCQIINDLFDSCKFDISDINLSDSEREMLSIVHNNRINFLPVDFDLTDNLIKYLILEDENNKPKYTLVREDLTNLCKTSLSFDI